MATIEAFQKKIQRLKIDIQNLDSQFETIKIQADKKRLELSHLHEEIKLFEVARDKPDGVEAFNVQMAVLRVQKRRYPYLNKTL